MTTASTKTKKTKTKKDKNDYTYPEGTPVEEFKIGAKLSETQREAWHNAKKVITPLSEDPQKKVILQMVRNYDDIQKMRIQSGNRICAIFMHDGLSIKNSEKADAEQEKILRQIKADYKRITDRIIETGRSSTSVMFKKTIGELVDANELSRVTNISYFDFISSYMTLLQAEDRAKAALSREVKKYHVYDFFKEHTKGCAEVTAATCIALFDPYKARHVSNFWSYAGLNPVVLPKIDKDGNPIKDENGNIIYITTGNCMRNTKKTPYISKEGVLKEKNGITYQPELKRMLLGIAAPNILKACVKTVYRQDDNGNYLDADGNIIAEAGSKAPKEADTGIREVKGKYANIYYNYRARKTQEGSGKSAAIIEKMARRAMMKEVVKDLWIWWRKELKLPVSRPYEEVFLGRAPHAWPNLTTYDKEKLELLGVEGEDVANMSCEQLISLGLMQDPNEINYDPDNYEDTDEESYRGEDE